MNANPNPADCLPGHEMAEVSCMASAGKALSFCTGVVMKINADHQLFLADLHANIML